MIKKAYMKPTMNVVKLNHKSQLLVESVKVKAVKGHGLKEQDPLEMMAKEDSTGDLEEAW
jgi:hypothetical protein